MLPFFFWGAVVGYGAPSDGDRCGIQHKQFEPVWSWLISTLWDVRWIFLLQPEDKSLNDFLGLLYLPIVCLCATLFMSVFYYFAVFDLEGSALWCLGDFFFFKVPKCSFYPSLTLLYTQCINASRRRPFAWKFSWFMTGFYSIFYNRPAHFCRGLVVAVVMPTVQCRS